MTKLPPHKVAAEMAGERDAIRGPLGSSERCRHCGNLCLRTFVARNTQRLALRFCECRRRWCVVDVHGPTRRKPVLLYLGKQLLARPECRHCWGDDPHRRELAKLLCETTASLKKWPNSHFIPEDPIALVFFEISGVDGQIEIEEVGRKLAEKTGARFSLGKLLADVDGRTATLGDL